jgi:hypothetical protein
LLDAVKGFQQLEVVVGGEDVDGVGEVCVGGVVLGDAVDQLFEFFWLLWVGLLGF